MVVFGKAEREKFEAGREDFSPEIRKIYAETHQHHDGKWLMIEVRNEDVLLEIENLLRINKEAAKGQKQVDSLNAKERESKHLHQNSIPAVVRFASGVFI